MCSTVNGPAVPPLHLPERETKAAIVNSRIWRRFDNYVADESKAWARRASTILAAEGGLAAVEFLRGGEAAATEAPDETGWFAYLSKLWMNVVPDGGLMIESFLGAKAAAVPSFLQDTAVRWIRENGMAEAVKITSASSRIISEQIRIGVQKGESTGDIAERIRKKYKSINQDRAMTIARTETHAAANYGSLVMAAEQREPMRKIWLATPDGLTRDWHMEASGQKRTIAQPFTVDGEELMFPGDGSLGASGSNLVNCRCTCGFERVRRPLRPRRVA